MTALYGNILHCFKMLIFLLPYHYWILCPEIQYLLYLWSCSLTPALTSPQAPQEWIKELFAWVLLWSLWMCILFACLLVPTMTFNVLNTNDHTEWNAFVKTIKTFSCILYMVSFCFVYFIPSNNFNLNLILFSHNQVHKCKCICKSNTVHYHVLNHCTCFMYSTIQ